LSFWLSRLISLIVAGSVANGPSVTGDGLADLEVDGLLGDDDLLLRRGDHLDDLVDGQRRRARGLADEAGHAGVLRTTDHDSSVRSMRTNR
jgi:hypothetical protein